MADPIPQRLEIETDALALHRSRPFSGMVGLGAFALFLLPLLIMMVGGGIFGMDKPAHWSAIISGSWTTAMLAAVIAGLARVVESPRQGHLVIEDGALTLGWGRDRTVLPRGSVVGGSVTPQEAGALLILSLADGRLASASVSSEDAGARALEALRIDPMGRALVGRFKGGVLRTFAGFSVGFGLFLLGGWLKTTLDLRATSGLVWLAVCLTFVASWLLGTRPPEIAVGADGVRIRGRIKARFIPLSQIESARVEGLDHTLVLTLADGAEERVQVALGNAPMLAAVAHRIELAKRATRDASEGASLLAVLGRGARDLAAWRDDLRARVRRADYRRASLEGGELEQLVGSAGASAEHRIGAALALREAGGDDARGRIRIAAEQCVDPRVRVALETIARAGGSETLEAEREVASAAEEERAIEAALAAASTVTAT